MSGYNDIEFMICAAARMFEDEKTAFVGYGMPQIAAILAQKLYAPNIIQIYEYGAIGPEVAVPFVRNMMADSRNSYRSYMWTGMNELMAHAQLGMIDYGVLGAAQIDPFGNINSTYIGGTYERPKIRFTGSGGANEVASHCWKTMYFMNHQKRRFLPEVEFITSPGYLTGPGAREEAGLPANTGPHRVITSWAVFDFKEETKRMRLIATREGISKDDVLENMNFEPHVADNIETIEPPRKKELALLREEIDPDRVVIGK
jgi:glutaconate CoA-transferase subunit B